MAWPAPARATVDLPRPGTTGIAWDAVLAGTPEPGATVRAGGLPVRVGPTTAANRSVSAADKLAAAGTPTKVSVDLLGRRGDRLLLRVGRADGVRQAGPVSLDVDYSGVRSRLRW